MNSWAAALYSSICVEKQFGFVLCSLQTTQVLSLFEDELYTGLRIREYSKPCTVKEYQRILIWWNLRGYTVQYYLRPILYGVNKVGTHVHCTCTCRARADFL